MGSYGYLTGISWIFDWTQQIFDWQGAVGPSQPSGGFIVNSYGGYSKKGYAPYNPKKKNQDALVMAEDPKTRSLVLCVMDGHGEDGDKVSQNIKSKFASYLFKHKDFAGNIKAALTDVIARCEAEILRGNRASLTRPINPP